MGCFVFENRDSSDDDQDFIADYVLDLVGNRLQRTTVRGANTEIIDYIYNALDQLTDESAALNGLAEYAVEYGYDLNGSQTNKVRTGTGAETITNGYNLRGRMTSVNVSRADGSATHAQYSYDHEGIRVSVATTNTPAGGGSATSDVRTFLNDAQNPTGYVQALEEYVSTGGGAPALDVTYTLGRMVESQHRGGAASAYLYDGHSGVRQVTSDAGLVTDSYTYDGFGVLVAGFGATDNQHRYRGEYQDLVTGDVYLRARWYASQLGRFDSRDPFTGFTVEPVTLGKYQYASDDPINGSDPFGLFTLGEINVNINTIASNFATRASTAFQVKDKFDNFHEATKLISGVVTGAPFDAVSAVFLALEFLPFGSALKVIGNIPAKLGKGSLDGASDALTDFYRKANKAIVKASEAGGLTQLIGESGAALVAKGMGFVSSGLKAAYHGADSVFKHGDDFILVEAKGGAGKLAEGQLSQKWLKAKVAKIRIENPGPEADALKTALDSGKLKVMLVETALDGDKVLPPKFDLRSWTQIGAFSWNP